METKRLHATLPADTEGRVVALFARLDEVDKDGDVVLASTFRAGQELALLWSHDWRDPIGKGVVELAGNEVRLVGQFFLDTVRGREAYQTVKAMGALQEWSWGFRATEVRHESRNGKRVRVIVGAEVYEVSPVLVGAGNGTGTLALKRGAESAAHRAIRREWLRWQKTMMRTL